MILRADSAQALAGQLAEALAAVAQRALRSLVVVRNGRFGAGAGVIWRAGGYMVTNSHVIAQGRVRVFGLDGREYPTRLVAQEPACDLALLQAEVPGARDGALLPALIADSRNVRVGQIVMAAGHPWGQVGAVTAGIVSGLGEVPVRMPRRTVPVIRTDAELAPGSKGTIYRAPSGGALVNAFGGGDRRQHPGGGGRPGGGHPQPCGGGLRGGGPRPGGRRGERVMPEDRSPPGDGGRAGGWGPVRVALAARAAAVRAGLRALLAEAGGVEVIGEAAEPDSLPSLAALADVLILAAEPYAGEELQQALGAAQPAAVLLLVAGGPESAPPLPELSGRVWGALPLDASAGELAAAVHALSEGLLVGAPGLVDQGRGAFRLSPARGAEPLAEPLTERETEVLQLLAQGLANKQIAASLHISEHTVKYHISAIYAKLGAANRTEAVRAGVHQGLVVL